MNSRPTSLSEVVGQHRAKEVLTTLVESSKIRKAPIPHILLLGCSGFGKTTIAQALAKDRGVHIHVTNGAQFTTVMHLDRWIKKIRQNDIFFIDEIHRCPDRLVEILYTVMEDFHYVSEYKAYKVPPFTMIGATTLLGDLLGPFKGRFKFAVELDPYSVEDLVKIVHHVAQKIGFKLSSKDEKAATIIARMSRGTPRNVVNNTEFLFHWMIANKLTRVSPEDALSIIKKTGVDEEGLRPQDRKYLNIVRKHGPIGINSIVGKMGIDKETIMTDIEPYLMQTNKILIQSNGRMATFEEEDLDNLLGELE